MKMSHEALVDVAANWLFGKHPIVITEMSNSCSETPDAIGWRGGFSTLIECKTSRGDYYSDHAKPFRQNPDLGIGDFRYYLCEKGTICPDGLPNGWGLLETSGKRVRKVIEAIRFPITNKAHEIVILSSALRRIGQTKPKGVSIRAYYAITGERARLLIDCEEPDEKAS